MNRNEFIATTAARFAVAGYRAGFDWSEDRSITYARSLASKLDIAGVAPWLTPPAAPDMSALERAVVEAAESDVLSVPGDYEALCRAVRALRAARGGGP